MQFGFNLLLWSADLTDDLLPILEKLKKMGYDGVEIPVLNLDVKKYAQWGKRLDDLGLRRTGCACRTAADNPISKDPKIRAFGVEQNKLAVDCAHAAGVEVLMGPYHSALGEFSGAPPTADEWKWGVESMRAMAEHAGKAGVMLGVESLNRFETYLLNCMVDLVRFIKEVNHPNCRMIYDTFHAQIEEKNIQEAIRLAADYLVLVHVSENDRSTPGQGQVPWEQTFKTLKEVGYNGWYVVEAFGLAFPEIAAATKIWRKMFDTEEQLARDALAHMKKYVK